MGDPKRTKALINRMPEQTKSNFDSAQKGQYTLSDDAGNKYYATDMASVLAAAKSGATGTVPLLENGEVYNIPLDNLRDATPEAVKGYSLAVGDKAAAQFVDATYAAARDRAERNDGNLAFGDAAVRTMLPFDIDSEDHKIDLEARADAHPGKHTAGIIGGVVPTMLIGGAVAKGATKGIQAAAVIAADVASAGQAESAGSRIQNREWSNKAFAMDVAIGVGLPYAGRVLKSGATAIKARRVVKTAASDLVKAQQFEAKIGGEILDGATKATQESLVRGASPEHLTDIRKVLEAAGENTSKLDLLEQSLKSGTDANKALKASPVEAALTGIQGKAAKSVEGLAKIGEDLTRVSRSAVLDPLFEVGTKAGVFKSAAKAAQMGGEQAAFTLREAAKSLPAQQQALANGLGMGVERASKQGTRALNNALEDAIEVATEKGLPPQVIQNMEKTLANPEFFGRNATLRTSMREGLGQVQESVEALKQAFSSPEKVLSELTEESAFALGRETGKVRRTLDSLVELSSGKLKPALEPHYRYLDEVQDSLQQAMGTAESLGPVRFAAAARDVVSQVKYAATKVHPRNIGKGAAAASVESAVGDGTSKLGGFAGSAMKIGLQGAGYAAGGFPGMLGGRAAYTVGRMAMSPAVRRVAREVATGASTFAKSAAKGTMDVKALSYLGKSAHVFMGAEDKRTTAEDIRQVLQETVSSPGALVSSMETRYGAYRDLGAEAASSISGTEVRATMYLANVSPKGENLNANQIDTFMHQIDAATDPTLMLWHAASGTLSPAFVDTVRELYPEVYYDMVVSTLEELGEDMDRLPMAHQIMLKTMTGGVALNETLKPESVSVYQNRGSQTAAQDQAQNGNTVQRPLDSKLASQQATGTSGVTNS